MAKIVVECSDPNDLEAVEAATDQFQGKCNITYFRQAQAMVEAGRAKTLHDASKKIAEDTGETKATVRNRVYRGEEKVSQVEKPRATTESDNGKQENQEIKTQYGGHRQGAGRKPKRDNEEDSDALYQLKRWWKKATKKDRKKFMAWTENENL